ncbi:hypothetical protein VCUG_01501 [Vavraia culicis subsp. floridensis]|uniref:Uncharacterized protein n=1 Tax=Vavraia culicis (isolate floridensis) TaxID=948595 RepID=L2GV56_VAVCU|nr:uncharacterized protein VCUG_01501 [Vavraia culicis subsp. floridensis]ELA46970.1 hypothetical protein VCUG_01501 [Vavraia culicis subsp. floridensis]
MGQERYPCLAADTMFALLIFFTNTISRRTRANPLYSVSRLSIQDTILARGQELTPPISLVDPHLRVEVCPRILVIRLVNVAVLTAAFYIVRMVKVLYRWTFQHVTTSNTPYILDFWIAET